MDISYYVKMNFTGFVEVIDALGGVSVYSDREFTVENIRTYQEGYNQLTGIEALAFARERMSFPEGDYQRAKNQMEVIRAVVEKAASPALLGTSLGSWRRWRATSRPTCLKARSWPWPPPFRGLGHPQPDGFRGERPTGKPIPCRLGAVCDPAR